MATATTSRPPTNSLESNTTSSTGLQALTTLLQTQRQTFLQPTTTHQHAAITATKTLVDPLAQSIVQIQEDRRAANRKKRKRGADEVEERVLPLKQIFVDGLGVRQVWEQARRVLDAALGEVERDLERFESRAESRLEDVSGAREVNQVVEVDLDDEVEDLELDGEDVNSEEDDDDMIEEAEEEEEDVQGDSDIALFEEDRETDEKPRATFVQDPNKLNDGFFSIDDFNKQSQFLEQMDARGDDDNPSDEDEIDWDADPMAQSLPSTFSKSKSNPQRRDQHDDDSDAGPTFGDVDLNAPESDDEQDENTNDVEEGDLDGMMPGLTNTNDILYTDFFEPPPQRPSKKKRMRALPKTQPPKAAETSGRGEQTVEEEAADLERAIADVRRDLLDSEDEADDLEDDGEDDDLSDAGSDVLPRLPASKRNDKNLSTHEKQQLRIREEIRRLEAINVSKKPWTLSGEASAQARPLNSLIEEDLEFERAGKPVPVITAEVSNDIEALIKRRILARDFDELVRRLPTAISDNRRGRADITVNDNKPSTSLGELYEQEYQQKLESASSAGPNENQSPATKKQHAEIDKLWNQIRDQLDLLSNLHFKPKRAEIEIKVVEDKPRIAMEDARPGDSSNTIEGGSTLAPQEIYKAGSKDSRSKEEITLTNGASVNREEMTREEKLRRRRREKERSKKAAGNRDVKVLGGAHNSNNSRSNRNGKKAKTDDDRENVVKELARGGVKVIGKEGRLEQLNGKKREGTVTATGGSTLKL